MNAVTNEIHLNGAQLPAIHFIGIAGAGMNALAQLFIERGCRVSGSDMNNSPVVEALRKKGARVYVGHAECHLEDAELVVVSPAIPRDNIEFSHARTKGIPVLTRAGALSKLLADKELICVSGSHGKTSTTTMLAAILDYADIEAGFMIGGLSDSLQNKNARWGQSPLFVSEACEAFRALDYWHPSHLLITNIDDEHLEHYGSIDRLIDAFKGVARRVPKNGAILIGGDHPELVPHFSEFGAHVVWYGLGHDCTVHAEILCTDHEHSEFDVFTAGTLCGRIRLPVPGAHNVRNALGAIAMAQRLAVPFLDIAAALATYAPVKRRWQKMGSSQGIFVYDDFAHHPAEIAVTLQVARTAAAPSGAVVIVLHPQLHSRVTRLAGEFAEALSAADWIVVLPVDAAGEQAAAQQSDALLLHAMQARGLEFTPCKSIDDVPVLVAPRLAPGDVVVTIGPEPVDSCGRAILDYLGMPKERSQVDDDAIVCNNWQAEENQGKLRIFPESAPRRHLLHSGFERIARLRPGSRCLWDGDTVWSYGELDTLANQVAHWFLARGVRRDSLVVLHLDKSPKLLALILGVLKAGAAYVPIDPLMARSKFEETLCRAGVSMVIAENDGLFGAIRNVQNIRIDDLWATLDPAAKQAPACSADVNDLAYAILTSGSTGMPRLVGIEHGSVVNLLDYSTTVLFDADDLAIVPFVDSISFDACVHQIFATLNLGGTLLFEPDLASLLRRKGANFITSLGTTPSALSRMLDVTELPDSVRVISLGGEIIPQGLLLRLQSCASLHKVFNFYGPTETTIFSTVSCVLRRDAGGMALASDAASIGRNIGRPVAGAHIALVDPDGVPVSNGSVGEIVVTGKCVGRGYLGAVESAGYSSGFTNAASGSDARAYSTGDLGRMLADGSIEFVGRKDDQFKLNGIRCDPFEIESYLAECPGIEQGAVVVSENGTPSIKELLAFVVEKPGADLKAVRQVMAQKLPAALVPKQIIPVASLPLTTTGKLDRRALLAYVPVEMADCRNTGRPRDDVEQRLVRIWAQVLRRPALGIHESFFDMGGDSLASMQLLVSIEDEFSIRLPIQAFETLGTVADMAHFVRRAMAHLQINYSNDEASFSESLRKQKAYVSSWVGHRHFPESLIVTLNHASKRQGIFWCLQGYAELASLAHGLGEAQPVHGMRSGHLVMRYTPETVAALAQCYAEEMMQIQPSGSFVLGGNCQGGTIARATALTLRGMGRTVSRLILMEQEKFWPYDEPVSLIFGKHSHLNPYGRHEDADAVFSSAYENGYSVSMIDGQHGQYFQPQHIDSLCEAIRAQLAG